MARAVKGHLFLIDPQIDFCDPKVGKLYVKNAENDMNRVAALIRRLGDRLSAIHVTLDQHHQLHIAHPLFWKDSTGKNPGPFTTIKAQQVRDGVWTPTHPGLREEAIKYLAVLEASGRYSHMIWPLHCLIGSTGAAIQPIVFEALMEWEQKTGQVVDKILKGSNVMTEHFSALRAEVPVAGDQSTQLNTRFIDTVRTADVIWLAGEARSHCVANSVTDLANGFNDDSVIKKLCLVEDCSSDVPTCEFLGEAFVKAMTARGMQVTKSTEIFA